MASDSLKDLLPQIGPSSTSIQNALRVLAARFRNEDDEAQQALTTLSQNIGPLFNDKMRSRLASFEQYCDQEKLEPLLARLTDQITSFRGAMSAIEGFDISWFRQLALSNTAKQSVAATLIRLCEQYAHGSNGFWQKLVDGDTEVLYAVSFDLFDPEDTENES